jgi:hypothetical protein
VRVFFLTSIIGLLAGWWIHTHLQRTFAGSTFAAREATPPPNQTNEASSADEPKEIPPSEFPALADAAMKKCAGEGAEWQARMMPVWIRWAGVAPEAALEHLENAGAYIHSLGQPQSRWAKDILLAVWASHDPRGAAEWFRQRLGSSVSGKADGEDIDFPALMETLALRDFPAAFSLIPLFFDQRSRTEKGGDFGKVWFPVFYSSAVAEANLPGFLRAVRGVSREDIRGQLCADVIEHLLEMQMPGTSEIIAQLPVPDRWPNGILNPWASVAWDELKKSPEPEKAADFWAAKVKPDDPGKSLVLEWTVLAWASRDPESAGQWLRQWDDDPAAKNARAAFVREASRKDAVTAFELACEFSDPRTVALTAREAYFQLLDRNPDEAGEWLMSQDLPLALVSRLLGAGKSR